MEETLALARQLEATGEDCESRVAAACLASSWNGVLGRDTTWPRKPFVSLAAYLSVVFVFSLIPRFLIPSPTHPQASLRCRSTAG